jgi:hypothetical protein
MAKRKLKNNRDKVTFQHNVPEQIKRIRDHLTPFQDELSSVGQSWFHDLVEWYTKVLFPNLQRTCELVGLVRQEFWMVNDSQEFDEDAYGRLAERALDLFMQLEKLHAWLDQNRELFESIRPLSHDLSDRIEVINSDIESLVQCLRVKPASAS